MFINLNFDDLLTDEISFKFIFTWNDTVAVHFVQHF